MKAVLLFCTLSLAFSASPRHYNTGAKRIDKAGVYNVHLSPHTHDDVGWKKTPDQYYYGSNGSQTLGAVSYIITSVVAELSRNPNRTFTYVEQGFFQRWWGEQDDTTRALVRTLVSTGSLTFSNGGFTMFDEAGPSYVDMLDQTTLGIRFILSEFGPEALPKVNYQLDPFGHSAFEGSLMSSMLSGYSAVFWGRISYDDMAIRMKNGTMEWLWTPSPTLGDTGATLACTLPLGYGPPSPMNFDQRHCYNAPSPEICVTFIQDDPDFEDYNVDAIVAQVVDAIKSTYFSGGYRGTDAFVTAGADFAYENALEVFQSYDKLIHYVNLGTAQHGINLFYSSPEDYVAARLSTTSLPSRSADIMPYASGPHSYWTGYFTSRPGLKGYVRDTSGYLQACRQLQAWIGGTAALNGTADPLFLLDAAQATAQHHDAIAGTEKQHVAFDYARRLARGRLVADAFVSQAYTNLTGGYLPSGGYATCDLSNATICAPLEAGAPTMIFVYNARGTAVSGSPIRVAVGQKSGSYAVLDSFGRTIPAQLLPVTSADVALREDYYGFPKPAIPLSWLAWQADLPPAGYSCFFLSPVTNDRDAKLTTQSKVFQTVASSGDEAADTVLTNGIISVTISGVTGLISRFQNPSAAIDLPLTQNWSYFRGATNISSPEASGAYVFRPNGSSIALTAPGTVQVQVVTGSLVQEARQTLTPWLSAVVRLWANSTSPEIEYTVGPIPVDDGIGKEIIATYAVEGWSNSGPGNEQQFATDANCRDMLVRTRNTRDWPNYTNAEPVSGNYYPVNCAAQTWDSTTSEVLTIVTDRTHAGTGLNAGAIDLLVHRRLLYDDNYGVDEALNEPGLSWSGQGLVVRGLHRLALTSAADAPVAQKELQQAALYIPRKVVAALDSTPANWLAMYRGSFSGIAAGVLPASVHLVTLHAWAPGSLLVRLAHLYDARDAALGAPASLVGNATVSLADLLSPTSGLRISAAVEMTATGGVPLASLTPVSYAVDGRAEPVVMPQVPPAPAGEGLSVTLTPMQVRTFLCTVIPVPASER